MSLHLLWYWFTTFEVKLNTIFVYDEVERDTSLECRSNAESRTEFADGNLLSYLVDQIGDSFILGIFTQKLSHKLFVCSPLKHNFSIFFVIDYTFIFDLVILGSQIENFDVNTKLS
jgi:hypothetical protein